MSLLKVLCRYTDDHDYTVGNASLIEFLDSIEQLQQLTTAKINLQRQT